MEDNTLDDFLRHASFVEAECLSNHCELLKLLEKVHKQFRKAFSEKLKGPQLPAILMMNAYSLYLGAVRAALSGQSPPTFMILRGCLESAAFGLLARDPANEIIYFNRNADKGKCQEIFKMSNAVRWLEVADPNLAAMFDNLYDGFIELGGHPNVKSVMNHLEIRITDDGNLGIPLTILHDPGSGSITQALMACVETGITLLSVVPHVLPEQDIIRECHNLAKELADAKDHWLQTHMPDAFQKSMPYKLQKRRKRPKS